MIWNGNISEFITAPKGITADLGHGFTAQGGGDRHVSAGAGILGDRHLIVGYGVRPVPLAFRPGGGGGQRQEGHHQEQTEEREAKLFHLPGSPFPNGGEAAGQQPGRPTPVNPVWGILIYYFNISDYIWQ